MGVMSSGCGCPRRQPDAFLAGKDTKSRQKLQLGALGGEGDVRVRASESDESAGAAEDSKVVGVAPSDPALQRFQPRRVVDGNSVWYTRKRGGKCICRMEGEVADANRSKGGHSRSIFRIGYISG